MAPLKFRTYIRKANLLVCIMVVIPPDEFRMYNHIFCIHGIKNSKKVFTKKRFFRDFLGFVKKDIRKDNIKPGYPWEKVDLTTEDLLKILNHVVENGQLFPINFSKAYKTDLLKILEKEML